MSRFRYGVIIDFSDYLRTCGDISIIEKVDRKALLTNLVEFIFYDLNTECVGIDYLVDYMCHEGVLPEYIIYHRQNYSEVCRVLFRVSRLLAITLEEFGMVRAIAYENELPVVFQNSRRSFTIVMRGN